ncbi:hypothetical protein NSK_008697 [Nannochloropsis salina CCMP1776]|uniref:CAP-Gly domain-containing protein n=1 Tax=Nannochloropsis salina CCMP1776 TaxID=1027361 RepID=A0A4D9CM01_9STRA|nr:hypothetical protein NSK_008697 [Nannochloropsis salina CCMP1776]|eukprot:TFJ80140.1 hypothetical protein NSK_008697 [Nannochloropsis salina CCMP1776]
MQTSKSLSTPQLWQRCTSLVFYFIFAPFFILKWFWSFLPWTSTLRGEADEVRQERRRNGKDRGRRDSILDFRPPPRWLLRILVLPLAILNPPDARHLEHVVRCVDRGEKILLVGNQCLLGLDQVVFLTLLYLETGVCARRLHDAMFGRVPILSAFLRWTGGVRGTKNIAEKLMADGQPLLFYPGGLEESFKAPGTPTYGLKWGERLGFIMLAIKHEYTLIPFSSLGMEDAVCPLLRLPLHPFLRLFNTKRPPTAIPLLLPGYNTCEKQYFLFGEPLSTKRFQGGYENTEACQLTFDVLRTRVTRLIEEGKRIREGDQGRYVRGRLWKALMGGRRREDGEVGGRRANIMTLLVAAGEEEGRQTSEGGQKKMHPEIGGGSAGAHSSDEGGVRGRLEMRGAQGRGREDGTIKPCQFPGFKVFLLEVSRKKLHQRGVAEPLPGGMATRASKRLQSEQQKQAQHEYAIGDRVRLVKEALEGTVQFTGTTSFASGKWIGIVLDDGRGKNDGSVDDHRYFKCAPLHGIFVRETQVTHASSAPSLEGTNAPRTRLGRRAGAPRAGEAGARDDALPPKRPSTARTTRSKLADLKDKRDAVLQKAGEGQPSSEPAALTDPGGPPSSSSHSRTTPASTVPSHGDKQGRAEARSSTTLPAESPTPLDRPSPGAAPGPGNIDTASRRPGDNARTRAGDTSQGQEGGPKLRVERSQEPLPPGMLRSPGMWAPEHGGNRKEKREGMEGGGGEEGRERGKEGNRGALGGRGDGPEEETQEIAPLHPPALSTPSAAEQASASSSSSIPSAAARGEQGSPPPLNPTPPLDSFVPGRDGASPHLPQDTAHGVSQRDAHDPFEDPDFLNLSLSASMGGSLEPAGGAPLRPNLSLKGRGNDGGDGQAPRRAPGRFSFVAGRAWEGGGPRGGGKEGRRLSVGGREGDLAAQIHGLKALLQKKNVELETLRAKMEGEGEGGAEGGEETSESIRALTVAVADLKEEKAAAARQVEEMREKMARMTVRREEEVEEGGKEGPREEGEGQTARVDWERRCGTLLQDKRIHEGRLALLEEEARVWEEKVRQGEREGKAATEELRKVQGAAALAGRRVVEMEAQVTSLQEMIELLTLDKEQLLIDQEELQEKMMDLEVELETARLEREELAAEVGREGGMEGEQRSRPGEDGSGGEGEGEANGPEQNQRLRTALKRLQEMYILEKAEAERLRRREEEEVPWRAALEEEVTDLREWKARQSLATAVLHEQIESGQAVGMLVERLTEKNLALEEKVRELRAAMGEMEVTQELSEELEAGHAREARALHAECLEWEAAFREKEEEVRALAREGEERERLARRLQDGLRRVRQEKEALEKAMAGGGWRGNEEGMDLPGWRGGRRGALALIPSEVWEEGGIEEGGEEMGAWEAGACLARTAAKMDLALGAMEAQQQRASSSPPSSSPSLFPSSFFSSRCPPSRLLSSANFRPFRSTRDPERLLEHINRRRQEGGLALTLAHGRALVHWLLRRLELWQGGNAGVGEGEGKTPEQAMPPAGESDIDRARGLNAGVVRVLGPVEGLLDQVLRALQEEEGACEGLLPHPSLAEALGRVEELVLSGVGGREDGWEETLWKEVESASFIATAPFLMGCVVEQAALAGALVEGKEAGEGGTEGGKAVADLQAMVEVVQREVGRSLTREGQVSTVLSTEDSRGRGLCEDEIQGAAAALRRLYESSSAAFLQLRPQGGRFSPSKMSRPPLGDKPVDAWRLVVAEAVEGWKAFVHALRPGGLTRLPTGEACFLAVGEGGREGGREDKGEEGGTEGLLGVRKQRTARVQERLRGMLRDGRRLKEVESSMRGLRQRLWEREREGEVLRTQVSGLEELLHRTRGREGVIEGLREEVGRAEEARAQAEGENQVLSEALEVVKEQADRLEEENRTLRTRPAAPAPPSLPPSLPPPGFEGVHASDDSSLAGRSPP